MTPTPVRCCYCAECIEGKAVRTPDGRPSHRACELEVRERGYAPEHRTRMRLEEKR